MANYDYSGSNLYWLRLVGGVTATDGDEVTEYEFIIVILVGVVIGRILSSFVPAPKWLVRWLERKHD